MVSFPLMYYISTHDYGITYYILFGYSFFNYLLVFIAKVINDFIIKLVKKKNNEK